MANVTLKKEERKTPVVQGAFLEGQDDLSGEDFFNSLQTLEIDEARLTEQKEHLASLLNQLQSKAKEEFERRKRKVQILTSEVSDLRRRCEKFAGLVANSSTLE
jgi:hypothetical protein